MADCLGGGLPFVLDEIILHCGLGVQTCFIIIIALIFENEYACAVIVENTLRIEILENVHIDGH